MLMAETGEGWSGRGFCPESTEHFSRSYLCLVPSPVFTASSNGFHLKEWVDSVTLPPWDWLVLSSPIGCSHMHRNLLKSVHEGWAWAGNKDWLLAPGTFLLVVCHDLLHLRNQNDPPSISQSNWKKDAILSNITVSSFSARRAVLKQIPLGWQRAVHCAIGGDLPWGQSPLLAVGSAWISVKLMPFYSV